GYVPGPVLGACYLVGLLAAVGIGRSRCSGLRTACLLPALVGLALLLTADFFEFSWRYQLPTLVFAPLAGALGVGAFLRRDGPVRGQALDDVSPDFDPIPHVTR
ncbi:MAG TPA: glycosyltransferase family 2 protein, partial [Acidimicrobiia bacterium]